MRPARAILSLSTLVFALAGVSAFGADPPEISGAEPALPVAVPANGDRCIGAGVPPGVETAIGPETALQAGAELAAPDDPCPAGGSDPTLEAVTQIACDQPVHAGPFPSPSPETLLCADLFDGDCFAGCCGPRGKVRKFVTCCAAAGGACQAECRTTCTQRYCTQGPN